MAIGDALWNRTSLMTWNKSMEIFWNRFFFQKSSPPPPETTDAHKKKDAGFRSLTTVMGSSGEILEILGIPELLGILRVGSPSTKDSFHVSSDCTHRCTPFRSRRCQGCRGFSTSMLSIISIELAGGLSAASLLLLNFG